MGSRAVLRALASCALAAWAGSAVADEDPAPAPAGAEPADPNRLVADRLSDLLADHLGRTADATLRRQILVAVEATDALLHLAFRTDASGDPALIAETRRLLHTYLGPVLDRG